MQVLTTQGYKPIENITQTDDLIAYDRYTGNQIINHLISKARWTHDNQFEPIYEYDETGSLVKYISPEEQYNEVYGPWKFIKINNTWTLYHIESIWANNRVVHVKDLQIGDIIYDENDNNIVVTSLDDATSDHWWKLKISGDHSYIADGLTLHNASKYWVGGGSSPNWNATANTNWSDTSGGPNNATAPTAVDDVFFDNSGSTANTPSNISAAQTILSLTMSSSYSSSLTQSATLTLAGNFTLSPSMSYTASAITNTLTFASASTIATNGIIVPVNVSMSISATQKTISGSDFRTRGSTTSTVAFWFTSSNATTPERWITNGFINSTTDMGTASFSEVVVASGSLTLGSRFYGSLTISGTVSITAGNIWGGGTGAPVGTALNRTFRITSGSVLPSLAIINLGYQPGTSSLDINVPLTSAVRLNVNGTPNNIRYNLLAPLTCSTSLNSDGTGVIWTGSFGWTTPLYQHNASNNITLTPGNEYRADRMTIYSSILSPITIQSLSATDRATLILTPQTGSVTNLTCANFTRIDASRGRTINAFVGTVTDSVNIRGYSDIPTVAGSNVT